MLWLRSIRERPHTAVLLVLLSAAAVLTSMLGPLLVRAVGQSTLADALDDAGLTGRSLAVSSDVQGGQSYAAAQLPVQDVLDAVRSGPAETLWQPPELIVASSSIVIWRPAKGSAAGTDAQVQAGQDDCAALVITAGECPQVKSQVMIGEGEGERLAVAVGDTITFSVAGADDIRLTVVGRYDPAASAERAGLIRPGTAEAIVAGVTGDPLVMAAEQLSDLQLPMSVTGRMVVRPDLDLDAVLALRTSIDTARAKVNEQDRLLALRTVLPDTLDRVERQARDAQVLILVTGVQALFLAIFAIVVVLQRVGRARAAEWGVGRLRGVPRRRWLGSIYTEPLLALLLGLPLGFLAGVAVARVGVAWTLRPGTPVEPWRGPVLAAAVAATAIAVAALIAVSLRSLRRPLADLVQQQAEARRLGVLGAVAHATVVMLAAATVYQLVSGGTLSTGEGQLGLLAPGLLALAVAMLAVRGAVIAVRRITTRPPRSLSALVVGRHAARTPSTLNPAMIIAVGVALAVFATQVLALSVRNQGLRADAATGAATVLTVAVPPGGALLAAVRAADPDGRYAMAVQDTATGERSGASRVIAVDSSRLTAVTSWSPDWADVSDLPMALRGEVTGPVELRGREIRVDLADVRAEAQPLPNPAAPDAVDPPPPPALVLTLETGGARRTVDLGRLQRTTEPVDQQLTASLPCPDGCRLVAIGLQAQTNQPYRASFTITGIGTDDQPASGSREWLRAEDGWREQSVNQTVGEQAANAVPRPGAGGLGVEAFDTRGSGLVSLSPTDVADPLPALLGPTTTVEPVPGQEGVGWGTGLDGQQQKLAVIGRASILPRSLDDGVLVDLANAAGLVDPANSLAVDQVWLAAAAPASIERRLSDQGLTIQSRDTLAANRTSLENQATTRGAAVALTISAAGLLLTLLALVAARWADAGHRGDDWRALREGGVSPRRLRRLVGVEISVPAVLGVLVGLLSGVLATTIAAPRLPLVDREAAGPPLDLGLEWWPIALIAGGTVAGIMIISVLGALAEIRPRRWR